MSRKWWLFSPVFTLLMPIWRRGWESSLSSGVNFGNRNDGYSHPNCWTGISSMRRMINNVNNRHRMGVGPAWRRITDINPQLLGESTPLCAAWSTQRSDGRKEGTVCAEASTIGVLPKNDPSSIQSYPLFQRGNRSNSAQRGPLTVTPLGDLRAICASSL